MEKLSSLFTYAVHLVLITCISELGSAVLSSVLESKYYVYGSVRTMPSIYDGTFL